MIEIIGQLEKQQLKTTVADVRVGDTVKVHYKIREGNKDRIQIFQGLVIATKSGKSLKGSFTVRKVVAGIGVERTFPLHSPWIAKIERIRSGKVRRAKLTFVRRYALSSKFKLKDKGTAGTVWQEVAYEKEEIAKEVAHEVHAKVVSEQEILEQGAPVGDTESDGIHQSESGESWGDTRDEIYREHGSSDSGKKPTN